MKVSVYSNHDRVWKKSCENISYQSSNISRENSCKEYYTLSFTYINEYENDTVTFANSYTSTYTEILSKCEKRVNKKV